MFEREVVAQGPRQVNSRQGLRAGGRLDGGQERQAEPEPDSIAGIVCLGAIRRRVGPRSWRDARHGQARNAQDQRLQPVRGLQRHQHLSPRDDVDGAWRAAPAPEQACHAVQLEIVRCTQVKNQRAGFVRRRCRECRRVARVQ